MKEAAEESGNRPVNEQDAGKDAEEDRERRGRGR